MKTLKTKKYIEAYTEQDRNKLHVWGYWNKVNYDLIAIELSDFAPMLAEYSEDSMVLDVSPRIDDHARLLLLTATIKPSTVTTAVVKVYLDGFDPHDLNRTKLFSTMTVNGDPIFAHDNPMTGSIPGSLSTAAILNLMLEGMTMGRGDIDDDYFSDNATPEAWADERHNHRLYLAGFCGDIAESFELW